MTVEKSDPVYNLTTEIKEEMESCLSSAVTSIPDISLEGIQQAIVEALDKFVSKDEIVPDFSKHDVQVSTATHSVYKVTYKTQLNSVHFITGEEEIKTIFFQGPDAFEQAVAQAKDHVEKGAEIINVKFDHHDPDYTRLNVQYNYQPVQSINRIMMTHVVAV